MSAETVSTARLRTSAAAALAVAAQPANAYVYWAVAFLTTLVCVGWPPAATSDLSIRVVPSSMYQETSTAPASVSPASSAMEPWPEKETAVTWVLVLSESGMAVVPELLRVCVPALNVTVGADV